MFYLCNSRVQHINIKAFSDHHPGESQPQIIPLLSFQLYSALEKELNAPKNNILAYIYIFQWD